MVTKAQIERLHGRIDAIEARVNPRRRVAGCVIQIPDGWDTERVFEQHCQTYPEDARAEVVLFLREFDVTVDPKAYSKRHRQPYELNELGWRACDYESWRELVRAEVAAGRDPNVSLRDGGRGER